ncbi:Type 1 glutamine amidotransferase-like domain-containing protein [Facklamia sp. 7083-14-GEN3]|uniref:Type 1 glutamine amidotransferase-like domain-containing protein n=1 Tax=Facklamia sp. 7083-14-GEN3 TaxID=2973478 RepID=UPI00215B855E|nr:Type 1 glutamine amidotransferase-like domain-containing protein [Facklamia sp. 7083-14-GEN3]MCR8968495.1 Type 1 glutamine amidotransferase-like domain-containing protein [Facklamia sp. 7083-14-GEN3]
MKFYLTSHIMIKGQEGLSQKNAFLEKLKADLGHNPIRAVFISSNPEDINGSEKYARLDRERFEHSGFTFSEFRVVHNNASHKDLLKNIDLLFLAGGHLPTQNKFIHKIHLKDQLKSFEGTIIGVSAGSMNAADCVYSIPVKKGEAININYQRYLSGLGLTKKRMIPHFNEGFKNLKIDGLNKLEDIVIPDSFKKDLYLFPDGTYIYFNGVEEEIFGDYYYFKDGIMKRMSGQKAC